MSDEFIRIPALFMRGGTSKGVYLMLDDLPSDPQLRDQVILDIYGSPDIRQINGMGGADPLTSKVALLAVSRRSGVDIDYTFGYVGIDDASVDYEGTAKAQRARRTQIKDLPEVPEGFVIHLLGESIRLRKPSSLCDLYAFAPLR